jgi:hypothetical protein
VSETLERPITWDMWRDRIAKAVDGSHHTIEAIDQRLSTGRLRAWMTPDCCLLLEFVQYPTERACQVMWAAGDLAAILGQADAIEAFAKEAGCTEMLIESRPAWAKVLAGRGYRPWSVTVRKGL